MKNYQIILYCWLSCTTLAHCDKEKNIAKTPDNLGSERTKPMPKIMPFLDGARVRLTIQIPQDWVIHDGGNIAAPITPPDPESGKRVEFGIFSMTPSSELNSF